MGVLCSRSQTEDEFGRTNYNNTTMITTLALQNSDGQVDRDAAQRLVQAHDNAIRGLDSSQAPAVTISSITTPFKSHEEYMRSRQELLDRERTLDFDYRCRSRSTSLEQRADNVIHYLKRRDKETVYDAAHYKKGYGGQKHKRFAGDHFLSNVDLIDQTRLLDVAQRMPKGAHLHIHFNACLLPNVLLDIAKSMDRMFITSDLPLTPENDFEHFDRCEIQFSILCPEKEKPGDIFSPHYQARQTMRFQEFLRSFPLHYPHKTAERWLMDKIIFHDQEAHNCFQTASGAWEKFNGRTRMMKGLFNYETAYRRYTRLCLEDFMKDNIQYAEIRPNFMTSNQLYHDDGTGPINNWGIMRIIINEAEKFKEEMRCENRFFGGIKVIYCTPRSFSPDLVKAALDECIQFKKEWPQWIAGFDLVGEEAKGRPIKDFIPELLAFQQDCRSQNVDIPLLLHCGETLDMGTDTDGNLVDALLLGCKRIGHGFALAKHPYIMQQMKSKGVCLELCPISNEVLGLTPRVSGHSMYELLANGVHCTVNSDNGTLFRSSLSHDFYQVMVGKGDMGLPGWKQLILWSIEHSCLSDEERDVILREWHKKWETFLAYLIDTYEHELSKED